MRRMEEEEDYDDEETDDMKKYNNPRKQMTYESSKKRNDMRMNTPKSFPMKKEEEELEKSEKKIGFFRTPNGYHELKKPNFTEYTPSPGKSSMYEGRTRRTVRAFSHLNSEEYEMAK